MRKWILLLAVFALFVAGCTSDFMPWKM